jgi:2',3'-cyclic-nucleotide 2'-phosphodiesterase (5'-nucleotidase family)
MKRLTGVLLASLLIATQLYAREVRITILHTCDLHGNVLPTEDYEGNRDLGGIARCATVIQRVREQQQNVLLVDAGDTLQGTAIGYLSDGQAMVKALNHLRYDAWVWGNHEFDWGLEKLAACAEQAQMPILNANVRLAAGDAGRYTNAVAGRIVSRLKPYILRDVDGVKVAIIGLNTPGIPNWSRPRLIEGLRFADSVETLQAIIPALRDAGAQVLVLVCHQGYREGGDDHANQVRAIARNFPELDVIIGGHSHRDFPEYKISNILYCQANYFGIHLGRVDLVFDTDANRVVRRRSETLRMDERIPLEQGMLKLLGPDLDRSGKVLRTVVGEATGEFWLRGAPRRETPIHNLIFESIAEALRARGVKVDAIVHGILDRRATLARGAITVAGLWRIVPYENTIGVAQLTPAELREILDENAGAFNRQFSFRGIWGLHWVLAPDAPEGRRVVSIRMPDGSLLEESRRYAVAFNSYELASGGLRWKKLREIVDRPESELVEYDFQTREAVIDFVRQRGRVSPVVKGWWEARREPKKKRGAAPP